MVLNDKQRVLNSIFERCRKLNIIFDNKGYVSSNEANLIEIFNKWSDIRVELGSGQGNELKPDKNGHIKFNAIHSSSALCVNNFAPFKNDIGKFNFLNISNFIELSFEKKLPTGISIPNLDLFLESESIIIGVESKFTEYLTPKLPNHENNLSKYYYRQELNYLTSGYHEIIEHYINTKEALFLDVAQLIKHGIGLIKIGNTKFKFILNKLFYRPILVYIYWQPNNWYDFELFRKHAKEIDEFKRRIEEFVNFIPLSYIEFWKIFDNDASFGHHIQKVKKRYSIDI